eukprot:1515-Prorocentrum_minimum.AAC.1
MITIVFVISDYYSHLREAVRAAGEAEAARAEAEAARAELLAKEAEVEQERIGRLYLPTSRKSAH